MSQVTLQIGGRGYTVSCADGEEAHVQHLASIVDGKLAGMGSSLAPGDAKNLLFAALILADELEDARRNAPQPPAPEAAPPSSRKGPNLDEALEGFALRLERVAQELEIVDGRD